MFIDIFVTKINNFQLYLIITVIYVITSYVKFIQSEAENICESLRKNRIEFCVKFDFWRIFFYTAKAQYSGYHGLER